MEVPREELERAVREALKAQGSGELTARKVRNSVERRLGLPANALADRKEELMALISASLAELEVDSGAVRESVTALEDPDGGPARAVLLVSELSKGGSEAEGEKAAEQAMMLLAEACAKSELASTRLLDAQIAQALSAFMSPEARKALTGASFRLLSAMSTHRSTTERIVRSPVLPPLVRRLSLSTDAMGVQCAALLHNLAVDSPANRLRLLHAGALGALTRVIVEPAAGDSLKEHCLQAAASLAGDAESERSFPELLAAFLGARQPGTQRDALAALQLILERQPAVAPRLGALPALVQALDAAAKSADEGVAAGAAEIISALKSSG